MLFLFGLAPADDLDPENLDDRAQLLEAATDRELTPAQLAVREVLATQIINDDPPEVWATATRLTGLGLDRDVVLGELSMALAGVMSKALAATSRAEPKAYLAALGRLPLPSVGDLEEALTSAVREHPGIGADDADRAALAALGREDDDELVRTLLDRVSERLADDDGPLAWLSGDRTVHVGDLTKAIVMTHRLSAAERELGALTAGFDLVGFARRAGLRLAAGDELSVEWEGRDQVWWVGPTGWLEPYAEGALLGVAVGPDGLVTLDTLAIAPSTDPVLVARLRTVYDDEVDEPGLPVTAEDLVLGLQLADQATFAEPQLPLSELCQAAGLERRGHEVAHDEEIWANARQAYRIWQVMDLLDSRADQDASLAALSAAEENDTDPDRLCTVLRGLRDPDVLDVVADLLLGLDDDPELVERTREFSERLIEVAAKPAEVAVARWLAAVAAERHGEPQVAEAHLHLAVEADPLWAPALDRLAWYASDRGDAPAAVQLWRRLGVDRTLNPDLRTVEPFASARSKVGRNEPCWCGSGRKYKHCHLGEVERVPLPDRVGWLCRKAGAYLERRGGAPGVDVVELAHERAADPDDPDSVAEALQDPLVVDVALCEGGWFERFLADRGSLLPEDEALLAAAWTLVPRTLYEVIEARAGVGLTLQDLGAGEQIEVREQTFSRMATSGLVFCARAVPDGETHQLIGGLIPVTPGTETEVLRRCDEGLGHELCAYAARQFRPPRLQTREGEPLVECEAVIDLRDPVYARQTLDLRYEREGDDRWVELHPIDEDERILRAQLHLAGSRLTVLTHSEPRMDRVLDLLRTEIPDLEVVRNKRKPVSAGELPSAPVGLPPTSPNLPTEVLEQIRDMQERRWLKEQIPALGGLTPVEAAADPSRVEQLDRLLASFPDESVDDQVLMRPARIRQLLGLDPRR